MRIFGRIYIKINIFTYNYVLIVHNDSYYLTVHLFKPSNKQENIEFK